MQLSEANYMLIIRLLADNSVPGEVREFFINDHLSYHLEVQEVTKYTSKIAFMQSSKMSGLSVGEHLRPNMVIRLYHDAKTSEVISSQHVAKIAPRYDYPNKQMHLPNEKQQVMMFLKEWLQLCLTQGQVNISHLPHIIKGS
ncbi:DUF1249 domain-containing protein [Thalassotalea sp. LPB0316]|nr:DUF1249 domain-containing protein [Thalassotalea sp. LPB0316]